MRRSLSLLHGETEVQADMNLTPLIDVVFVVLIMFILVAPLVEIDRIQLAPSGGGKKADMTSFQENGPIKIHVYADNTVWLNSVPVDIDTLLIQLKRAYQANPNVRPQVFHDKKGYFGTYQSVKNAVEMAGYESLDVILAPR